MNQIRRPGLAVDPVGRRAFVVGAGEPVAEVDLQTLEEKREQAKTQEIHDAPRTVAGSEAPRSATAKRVLDRRVMADVQSVPRVEL